MTLPDLLWLLMRVAHTGAMALWLGGGLLYLLSQAGLRKSVKDSVWGGYSRTARVVVSRSFAVTVASGAYLVFDRLADPRLGITYIAALAAKIALVAASVWVIGGRRTQGASPLLRPRWREPGWIALALGGGALVLGVALTLIYEVEVGKLPALSR